MARPMFKRISLSLMILSFALVGRAQILQNIENAFQPWPEWNKAQFYFLPSVSSVFSQIDGDGASGYNKFGYQLALNTGYALNPNQAVELSFGISERGSQQGTDPLNAIFNVFHIRYQYFETGLIYQQKWKKLLINGGLRTTYLLSAEEDLGSAPALQDHLKTFGIMSEIGVRARIHEKWALQFTSNYGLLSLAKNEIMIPNPVFRTSGQFLNCMSVGAIYLINQR